MKIGQSIKKVRKLKGFNQGKFSKAIGVTQSYLSLIENDKKKPSLDLLDRISKVVEVPVQFIVWFSVSESDVPEHKKETYRTLKPVLDTIVEGIMKDGITLD